MTAHRHRVRHVHSGWPASYTGVIAAIAFAIAIIGFMSLIGLMIR
jgi:hypothetical protein